LYTEATALRALSEAHWDNDKALLLLHAKSFQQAMDKLVGVFGDVPKDVVRIFFFFELCCF